MRQTRTKKKQVSSRPMMSRAEARQFVARWKLVNDVLRQERLRKTPEEKFRELVSLMGSVDELGFRQKIEAEDKEARATWNRLRRICSGQKRSD